MSSDPGGRTSMPPSPGSCRSSRCPLGLPSLWLTWVNSRLASSEHPLSRVLCRSRRSGLHVARALVLRDEDPTPRPRVPTPFLGCLFVSSWRAPSVPSMIGGCAPRAPLSWSHSTRSWMPMEYSYTLCRGRGPALCSWTAVHSCRWPVTQHEIMSTPTLCSASGSVMCGLAHLHCTTHLGE
ncbi:Hypothetical protein DHA2_150217 [Giardia duodenalis]|uniref:Uncharacterized protein n=1 Tax=Giardia intestinalis TaxID=5741 RepID=V6T734_GIAIN|nr:Hypothetical protein DHA2_150217 [Giardia intestinalis]